MIYGKSLFICTTLKKKDFSKFRAVSQRIFPSAGHLFKKPKFLGKHQKFSNRIYIIIKQYYQ